MTRVLMVSTYPPSNDAIADYTQRLVYYLSKRACRVGIVTPRHGKRTTQDKGSHQMVRESRPSFALPLSVVSEALNIDPEIVHLQHEVFLYGSWVSNISFVLTLLALKIIRKKTVVTLHHVLSPEEMENARILFRIRIPYFALRLGLSSFYSAMRMADGVVVPSRAFKSTLVARYRFHPSRVHVISHAIDLDEMQSAPSRESPKSEHDPLKLLFYGYLRPGKGVEVLVNAVGLLTLRIPNLRLVILYKIQTKYLAYLRQIEDLIRRLNLSDKITLVNSGHDESLSQIISSNIAIFPFTSIVGTSSWSYVRIALYKKPLIVTRVLANSAELRNENEALVVEEGDEVQLAEAIERLAKDKIGASVMANTLFDRLENHNWAISASEHIGLYSEINRSDLGESRIASTVV